MHDHEIKLDALDAAERNLPADQPVYMLNMLRYRETALYAGGSDEPSCTGREAFHERYVPRFRRMAEGGRPIKRFFLGPMAAKLVAPAGARWDVVAINEYPDFATFRAIVDTDEYRRDVQPHRLAALEEFRLFALGRLE